MNKLDALAKEHTEMLNTNVLRKHYPHIKRVLATSTHVAIYAFYDNNSTWGREEIEGALFVVERDIPPQYQLIVLNRLNTVNMVEDITHTCEIQKATEPYYLFFCNDAGITFGIWFYDDSERVVIANSINNLIESNKKKEQRSIEQSQQPSAFAVDLPQQNRAGKSPHLSRASIPSPVMQNQDPPQWSSTSEYREVVLNRLVMNGEKNQHKPHYNSEDFLLTPELLDRQTNSLQSMSNTKNSRVLPSKEEFKDSLIRLVQDDRFIEEAYLEFRTRLQGKKKVT